MFSLLLAVLGFGFLVFIHELGHFIIAKIFKVKVECFSIGMGPRIAGFKKGETVYQIGAIPMGGFCQFKQDALKDDLPEVLTEEKFRLISKKLSEKLSQEQLSKYYRKFPPSKISIKDFSSLSAQNDNCQDVECLLDCYEKKDDGFYRKEELSDKDIFVIVEYLENVGGQKFEYVLQENEFSSEKEQRDFVNLLYRVMNIRQLKDTDSFFGVHPWKRLLIALAGPFMNYLLAIVLFSFVFLGARQEVILPNRILLTDDAGRDAVSVSPAKAGGLRTGDCITAINRHPVETFRDLSEEIMLAGTRSRLMVTVKRDGKELVLPVVPEWDKNSMRPLLGVYFYQDAIIDGVADSPLALELGLQDGDRIVALNGKREFVSTVTTDHYLMEIQAARQDGTLTVLRAGSELELPVNLKNWEQKDISLPYFFEVKEIKGKNWGTALYDGVRESNKLVKMTALSTYALIVKPKGNLSEQVGGPIKIGYFMKNVTEAGFSHSVWEGIRNFFLILSNISLALSFFNLLPLPALDGGYIVMCIAELIARKPVKMRYIYLLNFIALVLLMGLGVLVAVMDIFYIIGH